MPERKKPDGARPEPEFAVAYYTKELGPILQRQMLTRQLAQLSDGFGAQRVHGEDPAAEIEGPPPAEDRAG